MSKFQKKSHQIEPIKYEISLKCWKAVDLLGRFLDGSILLEFE